jgi:hypothetical protein
MTELIKQRYLSSTRCMSARLKPALAARLSAASAGRAMPGAERGAAHRGRRLRLQRDAAVGRARQRAA